MKTSMDVNVSRGFFVSAKNPECDFYKQIGGEAIIVARELNYCWERFVYTKELMHMFDDPQEYVNSKESLKSLLNNFEIQTLANSREPFQSEIIAFWRALCCLCPEKNRQEFLILFDKGHIDTYGIALQLCIPEQYIPKLLDNKFLQTIEKIK